MMVSISDSVLGTSEDFSRYGVMSAVGLAAAGSGVAMIVQGTRKRPWPEVPSTTLMNGTSRDDTSQTGTPPP